MRSLSPEETELWARVAATIRPLSRDQERCEGSEKPKDIEPRAEPVKRVFGKPAIIPAKSIAIGEKTLDNSWEKKLKSGSVEPDRILDLHGMSLNSAWNAIDRALEDAVLRGERILLLITGHHRPGEPPVQRGRIRAAVQDWLAVSRHWAHIAAVRGAHRRHGGGGSLYLIFRRRIRAR